MRRAAPSTQTNLWRCFLKFAYHLVHLQLLTPQGPEENLIFSENLDRSYSPYLSVSLSIPFRSKTVLLACLPYWHWLGYISNIFKELNSVNKYGGIDDKKKNGGLILKFSNGTIYLLLVEV